jgi:autotransporter-associated beta strand protein
VQTFNNANTYTGSTTINGGTLALGAAGSFANSPLIIVGDTASSGTVLDLTAKSAFTFSASQTVGGKGLIDIGAGKTVTFDGTVSPGNSIETLSLLGDAAFGNASILSIEIDESDSNIVDVLAITGDLDVASGAAVVFNVTGGLTLSQYVFGTYTGSLTGAFASATVPAGYVLEQGSGQLKLTLIPEPSSLALLLFGALGYLAMFRKRNG